MEITFHEYHPGGHNPTFAATFSSFFAQGYKVFLLLAGDLREVTQADVERWSVAGKTDSPEVNYLFVPGDLLDNVLKVKSSLAAGDSSHARSGLQWSER